MTTCRLETRPTKHRPYSESVVVFDLPEGVRIIRVADLARLVPIAPDGLYKRAKVYSDPALLLAVNQGPGRRVSSRKNWRQIVDALPDWAPEAEPEPPIPVPHWGWGSVSDARIEQYLRRCVGASIVTLPGVGI